MCNFLVFHAIFSNIFTDHKKKSYDFLDNVESELASGPWLCLP